MLDVGPCQLALHRVGEAYRIDDPSEWKGVAMRGIKSFPPLIGQLCDGEDPKGNVFQLAEASPSANPDKWSGWVPNGP